MNRPLLTILTAAAVASLTAGCSTLDTDAVATVDDATLTEAQLDEFIPLVAGGAADDTIPSAERAAATRAAISVWIEAQVFTQEFESSGTELDAAAVEGSVEGLTAQFGDQFTALSDDSRSLIAEYVTAIDQLPTLPRPEEDEVRTWFDSGPQRTQLACTSHILVATENEAEEIVDELAGTDSESDESALFASIAMERSTDTGSGAAGGFLSCDLADAIGQQFVPPFAAAALAATPGEPTEPVESEFGFHVLRLLPYDEAVDQLEPFYEQGYVQGRLAIEDAEVSVDSRYGVADGLNVVAPV